MPREVRQTQAAEPPALTRQPYPLSGKPWPRGTLRPQIVTHIKSPIRYRYETKDNDTGKYEVRWYQAGEVHVAFVECYKHGTTFGGNYAVYMDSRPSRDGTWFDTEDELHAFIKGELERDPK